jgi:hypothetical protein
MTAHTAASDRDYESETGNETPDPRLAEEEYRERRLAEFIEHARQRLADVYGGDFGMLLCDVVAAWDRQNRPHLQRRAPFLEPFLSYSKEFGWPSTLRALASALEPPQ